MAAQLSDALKDVLDTPVFVALTTLQPDGGPQVSPVWVKRDGDELLISTTLGRRKTLNMERDPRVSVMVQPADDPYTYAEIRGTVTMTTEGGDALIDELAHKYVGKGYAEFNPSAGQDGRRVVVRVTPRRVAGRL